MCPKLNWRLGFICSQMSQLLRLLTQKYGNKRRCDNWQMEVRMTERYVADADLQNVLEPRLAMYICARILFLRYIFSTYDSISTWYNIDDTKAAG